MQNNPLVKKQYNSFIVELRLICWVEELVDGIMYARGRDFKGLNPDVFFELAAVDVSSKYQKLIREGAIFKVIVGYVMTQDGQKKHKTRISFRKYFPISAKRLEDISIKADLLAKALGITR